MSVLSVTETVGEWTWAQTVGEWARAQTVREWTWTQATTQQYTLMSEGKTTLILRPCPRTTRLTCSGGGTLGPTPTTPQFMPKSVDKHRWDPTRPDGASDWPRVVVWWTCTSLPVASWTCLLCQSTLMGDNHQPARRDTAMSQEGKHKVSVKVCMLYDSNPTVNNEDCKYPPHMIRNVWHRCGAICKET